MKALMGTAAVVVIATCGYFIYEDRQAKAVASAQAQASEQGQKYIRCRDQLRSLADMTDSSTNSTVDEVAAKLITIATKSHGEAAANVLVDLFKEEWEYCGPL